MPDRKIVTGKAIDCNIRQELAEVADAVMERKKHGNPGKQKSGLYVLRKKQVNIIDIGCKNKTEGGDELTVPLVGKRCLLDNKYPFTNKIIQL